MTAQGKRKENNEIKPLPPGLSWDVTTCLFSTAPVFSQLWKFLCSFGNMIHLFRERGKKKKKRREVGKKTQQFSFSSFFHRQLQALGVFAWSKETEKLRYVFSGRRGEGEWLLFPLPWGQVNDRQTTSGSALPQNRNGNLWFNQCTHTQKKGNRPFTFLFLNVCSTKTSTRFLYLALRKIQFSLIYSNLKGRSFFFLFKTKKPHSFFSLSNAEQGSESLPISQ